MNREWMYGDRRTSEYITGVNNFLEVAVENKENGFMCCPCTMCGNTKSYSERQTLHIHLLYKGFMPHYNVWTKHGEIGVMMEDVRPPDVVLTLTSRFRVRSKLEAHQKPPAHDTRTRVATGFSTTGKGTTTLTKTYI